MDAHNKTFLFWALVIGIFLIIFLLWLPQFVQSVKTLSTSLTNRVDQSSAFQQEWNTRIDSVKKNFDTLLKQTQTLTQSAKGESKKQPIQAEQQKPAKSLSQEKSAQPISDDDYCAQAQGKIQERRDKDALPYHVCIFADGSECEASMFHKGTCVQGKTNVAEDLFKR